MDELEKDLRRIVEDHNQPSKLDRLASQADSDNTGDVYSAGCEDGEYGLAKHLLTVYFSEAPISP